MTRGWQKSRQPRATCLSPFGASVLQPGRSGRDQSFETHSYRRFAMGTKTPKTSRILDAVHETARDLQAAGLISKRRMKDYDSLCVVPVSENSQRDDSRHE